MNPCQSNRRIEHLCRCSPRRLMAGWVEIEHKHQPHHCKIVSVNSRVNPLYFAIFQLENCVGRSWLLASRVDRIITDTHVCQQDRVHRRVGCKWYLRDPPILRQRAPPALRTYGTPKLRLPICRKDLPVFLCVLVRVLWCRIMCVSCGAASWCRINLQPNTQTNATNS